MASYNLTNTRGQAITTIGVGTTTGINFPIEMIGQGISLYGGIIAETQYHLMEHFADDTQPTQPVEGMVWYETDDKILHYYDSNQFIPLSGANNNYAHAFKMLPAATNVDFTVQGTTQIFTAPGLANVTHHPTGVLLIPKLVNDLGSPPITPATFNLYIGTSEDIMENVSIITPTIEKHAFFTIQGMTRFATNAESITLEIVSEATGAGAIDLEYDVIVFGMQRAT